MDRINQLIVDSTGSITDLCVLATEYPTDKSPYNYNSQQPVHRHSYTAVYDLLFSAKRYESLALGELGVLDNMSMQAWRQYFPQAILYGFDVFEARLVEARRANLPNTYYGLADVSDRGSLFEAFNSARQAFDILIDDSTHIFQHQVNFVSVAVEFLKPGGMLVVEDIFGGWDELKYCEALQPYYQYFSAGTFIQARHENEYSQGLPEPYYDNNKLLVLCRNQMPISRRHPQTADNRKLLDKALKTPFFEGRSKLWSERHGSP
jgi:hypothetical protein